MCIDMSEEAWAILAHDALSKRIHHMASHPLWDCRFCSMFGMTAKLYSWYWCQLIIKGLLPDAFKPECFLWTLHFLHVYNTEEVNCTMFGAPRKPFKSGYG